MQDIGFCIVSLIGKFVVNANYIPNPNTKVFVVYGHDDVAKKQLVQMLEGWDITPLYIDNLPTSGRTVIEQLEKYIPEANYGVVLATPDDIGYLEGHEDKKKHRARQNVILELGMLFSQLKRANVAIIEKKCSDFERPSDISGILYLSYVKDVTEVFEKLKKNLNEQGYRIP